MRGAGVTPLPADGWRALQLMLSDIGPSVHDALSDCVVTFGDAMSIFRTDAETAAAANPQVLLKLCKDFALQDQKRNESGQAIIVTKADFLSADCVIFINNRNNSE